jgi:hypothetical protein
MQEDRMAVRISSVAFARYLTAQSTTRVAKVRAAKRMMEAPHDDFKLMDYWLVLRDASVGRITGTFNTREFTVAISAVTDPKKISNYLAAGRGLEKWIGRKDIDASPVKAKSWEASGLEVSVTPELRLSWSADSYFVTKLYFNAEPLSKYQASPLLRLIECTHGQIGTAAVLDVQRGKLHTGPTSRPADLDLLLRTEAASFVAIWDSL